MSLLSLNRIILTAWASLLLPGLVSAELVVKPVFGSADPGGPYKHPAAIEELANGDLYIVFYGGQGEYEGDTAVYGSRLAKGATRWTPPKPIADTPGRSDGNGVIWQEPGGPLWLFYVVRYGDTWSDSVIKYKVSSDQGKTWSDSDLLTFERGMMVRSQPIQLPGGDVLLPIYHETGNDPEVVGAESSSLFARYDKEKKSWSFTDKIHSRLGNIQPSVAALDVDRLLAFCRRGGGYGPLSDGYMVRTESNDGGRTWSPGVETEFPNPNAAIDLIKLANGHLALIYNDSFEGDRMPLTMRISTDDGKTWPIARELVNKPGDDAAYPYIIQTADGKIHGVFTSQERSVVNHFTLDEADVANEAAEIRESK